MADQRITKTLPKPETIGTRITGAIRKLRLDQGFGFIAGDDGVDYFFHWSAMNKDARNFRELVPQDRVSFKVCVNAEKGPRAVEIATSVYDD